VKRGSRYHSSARRQTPGRGKPVLDDDVRGGSARRMVAEARADEPHVPPPPIEDVRGGMGSEEAAAAAT